MAIYYDNSATTQPFDEVVEAMAACMRETYFNPSSVYAPAVDVWRKQEQVRRTIAKDLGVLEEEIIFTSGGTESNNTAVNCVINGAVKPGHVLLSGVEHPSVYDSIQNMKSKGFEIEVLPCNAFGGVDIDPLQNALRPDTQLISIMHVNNESGAVNDIVSLGRKIKQIAPNAFFHVDGVQAYPKVLADLRYVDAYSISGHKLHGPRGIGALVLKKKFKKHAMMLGGGQEKGMRAGTENTAAILGLGAARNRYMEHRDEYLQNIRAIRDALTEGLLCIPDTRINSPSGSSAAPHILSVSFMGVRGETLLHALEEKGIYVSTGSACSSHKKGSRVLSAMNIPKQYIGGTIRISIGCYNQLDECQTALQEIERAVVHLRRFQRK